MMSILNLADRTEKRRVSVNVARVVGREPTVMRRRAMSGVTEDVMMRCLRKTDVGACLDAWGVQVHVHGCDRELLVCFQT